MSTRWIVHLSLLAALTGCAGDGDDAPGTMSDGVNDPEAGDRALVAPGTPVVDPASEPADTTPLPPPADTTSDAPADDGDTGLSVDEATATAVDAATVDSTWQVVYVNFDGPTITDCSGYCSDAEHNRSWVVGAQGDARKDFLPFTNAAARATIMTSLRGKFARYRVAFTTSRPSHGPYTMVVVSPSYWPHHGVAPLDCGNANRSDIAFVYRTNGYTAEAIAREVAHELGHSFGLSHVVNNADIMQWASSGGRYTVARYDTAHESGKCFSGSTQNAPAMLAANLGLR